MKYQLWFQDEYGVGSIIGTFNSTDEAVQKASELVTDSNFNNALTFSEQMTLFESYFVELEKDFIYCGNRLGGQFRKFAGKESPVAFDPSNENVSIYIGSKFSKDKKGSKVEQRIYLEDGKKQKISKVNHDILKNKSVYFIQPI